MFILYTVFSRSLHNKLIKKAIPLLLPAFLIVGSNFILNNKIDTQPVSSHKVVSKRAVTASPAIVFEIVEESEPNNGFFESNVAIADLSGLFAPTLVKVPVLIQQFDHPLYQVAYSLAPRAPPAL